MLRDTPNLKGKVRDPRSRDSGNTTIIDALRRSQKALKPSGEMLIIDYMQEDDKTGPLDPALVNLAGLGGGRYLGRVNIDAEWCGFLAEAGYINAVSRLFTPYQLGLITAQKPG